MSDVNFQLLKWQREVISDKTRFKVVVAGRRCGKSRLAAVLLLMKGMECPEGSSVLYVAPTLGQARKIMWDLMLRIGKDLIESYHVNNSEIKLINGVIVYICGADNPDSLRGPDYYFAVLDEYADIKIQTWEQVIRAALSKTKGDALFIGTPKGRNHFYDIYKKGLNGEIGYKSWQFTTADNPFIEQKEIEDAKSTMSSFAFKQEYLASFDNVGTNVFREEWIKYGKEPKEGSFYIAIDLAGFEAVATQAANSKKRLDQCAIAIVKVTDDGKWFVKKVEYGRWDVRETSVRILKNIREYRPISVGIEKGVLMNAVYPYLTDLMRKNNIYAHIDPLTHGNRKKEERIIWGMQGRFEHGRVILNVEEDWTEFKDQLLMFPTKGVHDDLVDAVAYVDQMAITSYSKYDDSEDEEYDPVEVVY